LPRFSPIFLFSLLPGRHSLASNPSMRVGLKYSVSTVANRQRRGSQFLILQLGPVSSGFRLSRVVVSRALLEDASNAVILGAAQASAKRCLKQVFIFS
jgi:hypothetical protein